MGERKSALDRALGLVTRVGPGEGASALILAFTVFLLLSSYYVIKPVREALILSGGGAEVKSYAAAGQVALLSLLVPAYGALVSRVRRQILIPVVTLGFCLMLLAFYLAARVDLPHLGVAFYLFVGVFNLMIVAQFWSLANDLYSREQGERLFPILGFGASAGAVAGSGLTSLLVKSLGVDSMLIVSSALLALTVLLTRWLERRAAPEKWGHRAAMTSADSPSQAPPAEASPENSAPEIGRNGAFRLVFRSPYLLLIAGLMFVANFVNTNGEYLMGSIVEDAMSARAATPDEVGVLIGQFYADFFLVVNLAGLAAQLFVVSRLISWLGVSGSLLVLPCIALGSYALIATFPVLVLVRWAKTAENATDYSLNNTVRNALFLPLTAEEKFKAKQATDTFFVRGGDVASSGLVALGSVLSWELRSFALVNLFGATAALLLAVLIARRYRRLSFGTAEAASGELNTDPA